MKMSEGCKASDKDICSVEKPGCFIGYGSQNGEQHIFYRTTSKEYGWHAPAPSVYHPIQQKFSNHLAAAGMYRNHSLNTSKMSKYYK